MSSRLTEPIVGWRGWRVLHPHFLVGGNLVYEPRRRHEARCGHDHMAPDIECTCGIYSFKSWDELGKQHYLNLDILGEVWLWGRVIEFQYGYRAQFSYPKKLYVGKHQTDSVMGIDVEALAYYMGFLYGVPVEFNAQIASRANPNYRYGLHPTANLSKIYTLPPRQMEYVTVLRDLCTKSTDGWVDGKAFRQSVKALDTTPVILGSGTKDTKPRDRWSEFKRIERNLLDGDYIVRSF